MEWYLAGRSDTGCVVHNEKMRRDVLTRGQLGQRQVGGVLMRAEETCQGSLRVIKSSVLCWGPLIYCEGISIRVVVVVLNCANTISLTQQQGHSVLITQSQTQSACSSFIYIDRQRPRYKHFSVSKTFWKSLLMWTSTRYKPWKNTMIFYLIKTDGNFHSISVIFDTDIDGHDSDFPLEFGIMSERVLQQIAFHV